MKLKDWGVALMLVVLAMALNVAVSFAWVFVYSLVEPGQTEAAYQAYAQQWAPVSSVVFGLPILFAAGWFVARSREPKRAALTALAVAGLYIAIDAAVVIAAGALGAIGVWVVLSWATKLGAAWLGAYVGTKRA